MNETQNPRDAHPGGLHNDGDQHVTASVPPEPPHVARLRALDDDALAAFSHDLDTALRDARRGPHDPELDDLLIIAVVARGILRDRRARAAAGRAKDIVRQLMTSTESTE
jgi:hypothetical protein